MNKKFFIVLSVFLIVVLSAGVVAAEDISDVQLDSDESVQIVESSDLSNIDLADDSCESSEDISINLENKLDDCNLNEDVVSNLSHSGKNAVSASSDEDILGGEIGISVIGGKQSSYNVGDTVYLKLGTEKSSYTPATIYVQVEGEGYFEHEVGTYSQATSSTGVPFTFTTSGTVNLRLIQSYYGTYFFSDYVSFKVEEGSSLDPTSLSLIVNSGTGNTTNSGQTSITVNEGDMITLFATLSPSKANPKLVLYQNGTIVQNRTFYSGWFSPAMNNPGEYVYYVMFEGNNTHSASSSNTVTVNVLPTTVEPKDTITTVAVDDYNPKTGDYLIVTPTVTADGVAISEGTVEIYVNDVLVNSTTAGSTCNYYDLNSPGTVEMYAKYLGTDDYAASISEKITIDIQDARIPSIMNLSANVTEVEIGDSIMILNFITNATDIGYWTSFASQFERVWSDSYYDYIPIDNITIYLNGVELGTAIVNPNGIYPVNYTFSSFDAPGWYNFTASFAGNEKVIGCNTTEALSFFIEDVPSKEVRTAKDLQELIDNATKGSIIDLGNYDYVNISDINITKDITLLGDNTTISSNVDGSPIFNILPTSEGINAVNITGIEFKVNNADIIFKAVAENATDVTSIDVPAISITNNNFTSINDSVVPESVVILQLESERGVLSPTNEIHISNNLIDAGIKPFEFKVTSIASGSDVNIGPQNLTPVRDATQIIYNDMNTTAVSPLDPRTGEWFTWRLVDGEGKPIANVPMKIGFNGVIYDEKNGMVSDANGYAKLQINLGYKGDYTFAISFLGNDEYNASFVVAKIKVATQSASLTVPNKSYSASAKTKSLTATFKTKKGTAIAGKKITFTVNGKTYSAKTNDKGVATVNVSLNTKGTYSFTVKYAGDSTYSEVSKTAKLTIK